MRRNLLLLIVILLLPYSYSSALVGPTCSVDAQLIDMIEGKIIFEVLSVSDSNCPVRIGDIFQTLNSYEIDLESGEKFNAGVEIISSMSPEGIVQSLYWSSLIHIDGSQISSGGVFLSGFQTELDPIEMQEKTIYIRIGEYEEKNNQKSLSLIALMLVLLFGGYVLDMHFFNRKRIENSD